MGIRGERATVAVLLLIAACFNEETVAPGADGTTSATADPTTSATMPTTTTGPTTTVDTTSDEATSLEPTTTSPTTTESDSDPTTDPTTSTESTGTPGCEPDDPEMNFADDFERDDSEELGNCWIEKDPQVWSIATGDVVYDGTDVTEYFDHMVYRDVSILDVESTLTVRFLVADDRNEPHPMVRIQDTSFDNGNPYNGYILTPHLENDVLSLCIMRFIGAANIDGSLCEPLDQLEPNSNGYRLTLRASGGNPVQLYGRIDDLDTKMVMQTVEWNDIDGNRISAPGAVGFSGGTIDAVLENFVIADFTSRPL